MKLTLNSNLIRKATLLIAPLVLFGGGSLYAHDPYEEAHEMRHHQRNEKRAIKEHQREERYYYGNSRALRQHQREEKRDVREHQRDERGYGGSYDRQDRRYDYDRNPGRPY